MSTISASTTTTTAYKVTADTTGTLVLQTGATPTTAVTIDGSQNVGIGVTPSAWRSIIKALQLGNSSALWGFTDRNLMVLSNNVYQNSAGTDTYQNNGYAQRYSQDTTGNHVWLNSASGTAGNAITFTEAMRIDSSGNLLVGTTTSFSNGKFGVVFDGSVASAIAIQNSSTTANTVVFRNSSGTTIGTITNTNTATAYNTSSDYRLKENIQPMQNALGVVQQLKPCTYTWKADGSDGQGFIAHELQEVVPDCVTGEKDAVDAEGNPVYQGIDTSFLVATLTAAIQEQQAIIQQLTARIETLEAK